MSNFQHKPDSGSLFKNDKREKDTHPHAKGSALIDGVEYFVSAWTNDGKNGKYQSLKFTRKDDVHKQGVAQAREAVGAQNAGGGEYPQGGLDEDIPFAPYHAGSIV